MNTQHGFKNVEVMYQVNKTSVSEPAPDGAERE